MKNGILIFILCSVIWSCSTKTQNKNGSDSVSVVLEKSCNENEEVLSDAENCFKQWNADNPKRPDIDYRDIDAEPGPEAQKAHKEYIKQNYGKEHSRTAIVRMYDKCPQLPNGLTLIDENCSSMIIETGDFMVYSIWRGPVVAKNKSTGYWFVVWDEDYNYNTKHITTEGDGLIVMEYIDGTDVDGNTDVIHYNLYTHRYYFAKEKYSGSIWSDNT